MGGFHSPLDFSGVAGYPHDISDDVIENFHIRAFGQCIDEWCDPPIYEDVLMELFVTTLCEEDAYYWFHDSDDNKFKTI
jgi:hypothetical protein